MPKYTPPLSPPSHEVLIEHIEYNPIKGTFTRLKPYGRSKALVGEIRINKLSPAIALGEKAMTLNQIAWYYMTGVFPTFKLQHKDKDVVNYKWENIKKVKPSKKGNGHRESIELINGTMQEIDGSPPYQPKTLANKKRMAGICYDCIHYIKRCLDADMTLDCIGKETNSNKSHLRWVL